MWWYEMQPITTKLIHEERKRLQAAPGRQPVGRRGPQPRTSSSSAAALLRVQAGYTLRELAEMVGVPLQQIYELEHGRKRPVQLMNTLCSLYRTGCEIFHPDMFLSEKHQDQQRHELGQLSAIEFNTLQIWTEEQLPPTPEELVANKEEIMLMRSLARELGPREQRVLWSLFYLDEGIIEIMNSLYPGNDYKSVREEPRLYGEVSRIRNKALDHLRRGMVPTYSAWLGTKKKARTQVLLQRRTQRVETGKSGAQKNVPVY